MSIALGLIACGATIFAIGYAYLVWVLSRGR